MQVVRPVKQVATGRDSFIHLEFLEGSFPLPGPGNLSGGVTTAEVPVSLEAPFWCHWQRYSVLPRAGSTLGAVKVKKETPREDREGPLPVKKVGPGRKHLSES